MEELAGGLWRWTARHGDWHPGEWGAEVASFALDADGVTLLVDPLLPEGDSEVLAALDDLVTDRVAIVITLPYHTRSAEPLRERYAGTIHGHPKVADRLGSTEGFEPCRPGDELPGGARPYAIPRRAETPVYLPSHLALAFGDALVTNPEGELRIWSYDTLDEKRLRFYRERFAPSLGALRELDVERVLVTHGEPILRDGAQALAAALDAPPWYHR